MVLAYLCRRLSEAGGQKDERLCTCSLGQDMRCLKRALGALAFQINPVGNPKGWSYSLLGFSADAQRRADKMGRHARERYLKAHCRLANP